MATGSQWEYRKYSDDGIAMATCFALQLPLWYEMWWDNGVFPGQPAADFMFGPLPANLTEVSTLLLSLCFQQPAEYKVAVVVDRLSRPGMPRRGQHSQPSWPFLSGTTTTTWTSSGSLW
jgi:hypothetical protein